MAVGTRESPLPQSFWRATVTPPQLATAGGRGVELRARRAVPSSRQILLHVGGLDVKALGIAFCEQWRKTKTYRGSSVLEAQNLPWEN